jgi:hypothetical protein
MVKGEKSNGWGWGQKCPKKYFTVLLYGNMVGEMEKPLMTGKAAKPRCLKNLKIHNLPVT